MKKMFKVIATVAAILSMANFVACSNDDDSDDDKVAVTSVTLDKTEASVKAGETVTLTATVAPENATNKTVTWASTDTTIATVDGGVVTGVKAGTATITATADGKSASAEITVTAADSSEGGSTDSGTTEEETTDKINLTVDITSLDFTETTTGLTNTAESGKNGTFMIPSTTKILNVLTPTKDSKAFWYTDKAFTKIAALQLNSEGELKFTLSGAATVKVSFQSTGDSNTSAITVNGTENSVTGKTVKEFSWNITDAGDYTISSTGKSNARITALSIVEE